MRPEIWIAIVSGVITLVVSLLLSMAQARMEVRKLENELEGKYRVSLFDKRLDRYSALFKTINDLQNAIKHHQQNRQLLIGFQTEYEQWLAANALLLTPTTAGILWKYQSYLINLLDACQAQEIPEDDWREIYDIQVTIGKFLRAELGIFDLKPAGHPDLDKPYIAAILTRLHQRSDREP